MKVIVFDIWGDYGHFKKFHTTASPLTFSFPPPTAVIGIVAAILGIDKESYWQSFSADNTRVAVRIINPVKKIRTGINVIETKSAGPMFNRIKQRSQIKYEYLKDARFRIFFSHDDMKLMQQLEEMLAAHKTIYTLCLGTAQMLAGFAYVGLYEAQELPGEYNSVHSVIPLDANMQTDSQVIRLEANRQYTKEVVSTRMKDNREVLDYKPVLFDLNAMSITSKVAGIVKVGDENVVFM
ncbi:MAG: type I-B CRISPR-associated protein Cas5b [Syntrophomonadaceae bacterium]|nr:type I-B CRISPR-associated protein Cas5b [Syntrophomonadaceae bacterium]